MTPDKLRELADRVERGEEGRKHIAEAMGIVIQPIPYFHLNIEDSNLLWNALRHNGWTFEITISERVTCNAYKVTEECRIWTSSGAATEARARTAIALRCRAVELEAEE